MPMPTDFPSWSPIQVHAGYIILLIKTLSHAMKHKNDKITAKYSITTSTTIQSQYNNSQAKTALLQIHHSVSKPYKQVSSLNAYELGNGVLLLLSKLEAPNSMADFGVSGSIAIDNETIFRFLLFSRMLPAELVARF